MQCNYIHISSYKCNKKSQLHLSSDLNDYGKLHQIRNKKKFAITMASRKKKC